MFILAAASHAPTLGLSERPRESLLAAAKIETLACPGQRYDNRCQGGAHDYKEGAKHGHTAPEAVLSLAVVGVPIAFQ